ncbi:MAG: HD domain-containing protein [Rhodospirillales bacterium]
MDTINFTRMQDSTKEEYELLSTYHHERHRAMADKVLAELKIAKGVKTGHKVDRYIHSLQTATRAYRDGADEETVVCAVLHDIGDALAPLNHPEIAAAILKPYIGADNHWLVLHHSIFQGYFFWHHIGQDRMAREKFRGHAMFERTASFCERWDQTSFDPQYDTMPFEAFEPMIRRLFARPPFAQTEAAAE